MSYLSASSIINVATKLGMRDGFLPLLSIDMGKTDTGDNEAIMIFDNFIA